MRAPARLSRGPRRAVALLALLLLVLVAAPPAGAAGGRVPAPAPGHPWFGPALDIHADDPSHYVDRLGATPSLYTFPADYPLTTQGTDQLARFVRQVAAQGAVLVLQLQPTVPLDDLTTADADRLAALVSGLHRDHGTDVLVRFAPEMNGSWRPWGQQPGSYVRAFRGVAAAVHAATDHAAMVWSPVYGSGYPFGRAQGTDSEIDLSGSRQTGPLDTNGDGRLGPGDDPYGPYYPGDDAVDWVGLFLYRFGQSQGVHRNVRPPADEVAQRLAERWGYDGQGSPASFYDRFARGHDKPLLLETSALYNPAVGGTDELTLKRTWWREVFDQVGSHPMLGAISWLELDRVEPEVADEPVDWTATRTPRLADALRADLARAGVRLGPVTAVHALAAGDSGPTIPSSPPAGHALAWQAVTAVVLVFLLLVAQVAARRAPGWAYAGPADGRDARVDLARGLLLLGLVVLHLQMAVLRPSPTVAGLAPVGGAEALVLVAGLVTGLRDGRPARRWRRAVLIWGLAVLGAVLVGLLRTIPGVDGSAVTTLTLPGGGHVDLYRDAGGLLDYPTPWPVVRDLLLLRLLPAWLVPLGLFVALLLVAPLATWVLRRGGWWVVLVLSWGIYVVGRTTGAHVLPTAAEDVTPVLVWQLVFAHGLVAGHHRARVGAWLRSPAATAGTAALAVAWAAALVDAWAGGPGDGALRRLLDLGAVLTAPRLVGLAVLALVATAVLTHCWRPLVSTTGRLLLPVGRHPLPVLLAHVLVVLALADVDVLRHAGPWLSVVVDALVVALLWGLLIPAQTVVADGAYSSSRSITARARRR